MAAENSTDPILKHVIALGEANPDVAVIWLYGSRAKHTAHAASDYDLAIAFNEFLHDALATRLRAETLAIDWQQALKLPENKLNCCC